MHCLEYPEDNLTSPVRVRPGRAERLAEDVYSYHLKELLRSVEVLGFDWHRLVICCAGAGETAPLVDEGGDHSQACASCASKAKPRLR